VLGYVSQKSRDLFPNLLSACTTIAAEAKERDDCEDGSDDDRWHERGQSP
jgi:hypothetical protein